MPPHPGCLSTGGSAPAPRAHFWTPKSGRKNRWGDPRPPFLSNRTPTILFCAATETPRFGWSLVIGAVVNLLRLSALGMIGTSCRAIRIDESVSLTGKQSKPDEIPATDQIPEGSAGSVAMHHHNLIATDWTKDSKTLVLACFWVLFARAKSTRGCGGAQPPVRSRPPGEGRISPLGPGRPGRKSGLGAQPPKIAFPPAEPAKKTEERKKRPWHLRN